MCQAVDEVTRRSGQPPIIVGHSIGGGVAQVYATDSVLSRKIAGLGLLSSFPPGLSDGVAVLAQMVAAVAKDRRIEEIIMACLLREGLLAVAPTASAYCKLMGVSATGGCDISRNTDLDTAAENSLDAKQSKEVEYLRLEPSASWLLPLQIMLRLSSSKAANARGERRSLTCVVLGGEEGKDRLVSGGVLERTAERYGARAIRVAGVGHAMMARAGGDWEVAARTLLHALRESHGNNSSG